MTALIVLHALICLFLVGVILIQPGKGDAGIGFGSSSQSIFGSKGAGNFLTKTTGICATLFLLTSFVLTRSRIKEFNDSVIPLDEKPAPVETQKAADAPANAPAEPAKAEEKK